MPCLIKRAQITDAADISKLARASFWETFSPYNLASDMNLYMDQAFNESKQRQELESPKIHTFKVHEETKLVGFFQLQESAPEPCVTHAQSIELSRFYFLKSSHGRGVSHEAMRFCLDYSQKAKFEAIWLGVWEKNQRARAFYAKWGFHTVGSHAFQLGNDSQTDLILEKTL